ncbi:hypothetical protein F5Y17DRAFT_427435 [Xylariaceae sp. FL0594]|nr:hypothetical protein F5Y17DRAFT_427435 [Xylariaceae sp. FL0594]
MSSTPKSYTRNIPFRFPKFPQSCNTSVTHSCDCPADGFGPPGPDMALFHILPIIPCGFCSARFSRLATDSGSCDRFCAYMLSNVGPETPLFVDVCDSVPVWPALPPVEG